MEAVVHGHDFGARPCRAPWRRASLSAHSLASAPLLAKNTLPGTPSRPDQPLGEPDSRLVQVEVGGVRDLADLLADRAHESRVRVAERADRDAADEVQVDVAVEVPDPHALAAVEGQRRRPVVRHHGCAPALSKRGHRECPSGRSHRRCPPPMPDPARLGGRLAGGGQDHGSDSFTGEDLQQERVGQAAVEHVCLRDAALHRAQAGLHLRRHPAGQRGQQLGELVGVDLADDLGAGGPVGVEPFDVGEHDQLLGAQPGRHAAAAVSALTL